MTLAPDSGFVLSIGNDVTPFVISIIVLSGLIIATGCWLSWQLLRQNGRILLRLDELEKRLDVLEFDDPSRSRGDEAPTLSFQPSTLDSQPDNQNLVTSAATSNGDNRNTRFSNRSLARSRIKRDGLEAGSVAPNFHLPRLDGGGELSLEEFRGQRVLLIFSDPHCGPCQTLAPHLEKLQRDTTRCSTTECLNSSL